MKLFAMGIKNLYNKMFCPYKISKHREIYEQVAGEHGLHPNRVYKIAHGKHTHSFAERDALNDLIHKGIVQSKWFLNR